MNWGPFFTLPTKINVKWVRDGRAKAIKFLEENRRVNIPDPGLGMIT